MRQQYKEYVEICPRNDIDPKSDSVSHEGDMIYDNQTEKLRKEKEDLEYQKRELELQKKEWELKKREQELEYKERMRQNIYDSTREIENSDLSETVLKQNKIDSEKNNLEESDIDKSKELLKYFKLVEEFLKDMSEIDLNMSKAEYLSDNGIKHYSVYMKNLIKNLSEECVSEDFASRKVIDEFAVNVDAFLQKAFLSHPEFLYIKEVEEKKEVFQISNTGHITVGEHTNLAPVGEGLGYEFGYGLVEGFMSLIPHGEWSVGRCLSYRIYEKIEDSLMVHGKHWYYYKNLKEHQGEKVDYFSGKYDFGISVQHYLDIIYGIRNMVFSTENFDAYKDVYEYSLQYPVKLAYFKGKDYLKKQYKNPYILFKYPDSHILFDLKNFKESIIDVVFYDMEGVDFDSVQLEIISNSVSNFDTEYDNVFSFKFLNWKASSDDSVRTLEMKISNNYYNHPVSVLFPSVEFRVYTVGRDYITSGTESLNVYS